MHAKLPLAGILLIASGSLGAQTATVSGTFVSTLGSDTVAIERYTRTGTRLEGRILTRYPRVLVAQYVVDIGDRTFRGMALSSRPATNDIATPPILSVLTLVSDSTATVEVQRNGRPDTASSGRRTFRGRAAPMIPGLPPAFGLYEQILAFHPVRVGDTARVPMIRAGPGNQATLFVTRRPRDTVIFGGSFAPGWVEAAIVDSRGRIVSANAHSTTFGTTTRRVQNEDVDFDGVARAWNAIEAVRGRAGRLSPSDTLRAMIGGASLEVVYGRPSKRGRDIWGNVVEWGKVWRTGADAATQLTTSADLRIGTATVPAGRYTLWTMPAQNGTKLIINTQTGQWGTEHNAAHDLVRLDMTQTILATPIEAFTISIFPQGSGGVLRLSWDNREFSIPFATL